MKLIILINYLNDRLYKNILISCKKEKLNIKRLYKGIQYPMIRSIPSSIVGFYVYEYMLKLI